MAHGQVARMILSACCKTVIPGTGRAGAGILLSDHAEYVALFHDGVYKHSKTLGHF